jgi:hypothetical protein
VESNLKLDASAAANTAGVAEELPASGTGWVRGDGSSECPSEYPVKGNEESMLYHGPGGRSYAVTQPEFCFASEPEAEAAGYSAAPA